MSNVYLSLESKQNDIQSDLHTVFSAAGNDNNYLVCIHESSRKYERSLVLMESNFHYLMFDDHYRVTVNHSSYNEVLFWAGHIYRWLDQHLDNGIY